MTRRRSLLPGWAERLLVLGWALLTSPRTLLATLGVLLVLACVGGLVPQADATTDAGLVAQAAWLAQLESRSTVLYDVVQAIGLLHLFRSAAFRVLLAWVAALCLANLGAIGAHGGWTAPGRSVSWTARLGGDIGLAWERVAAALRLAQLQLARPASVGRYQVAVSRRAGARGLLPGLVYVGVLCLLLAGVVRWRWGWRGADVTLLLGDTQRLDARTSLAARLDEVKLTPGASNGADTHGKPGGAAGRGPPSR